MTGDISRQLGLDISNQGVESRLEEFEELAENDSVMEKPIWYILPRQGDVPDVYAHLRPTVLFDQYD